MNPCDDPACCVCPIAEAFDAMRQGGASLDDVLAIALGAIGMVYDVELVVHDVVTH